MTILHFGRVGGGVDQWYISTYTVSQKAWKKDSNMSFLRKAQKVNQLHRQTRLLIRTVHLSILWLFWRLTKQMQCFVSNIFDYFRSKSPLIVVQFLHCLILPIWYLCFLNETYLILLHYPASPSCISSFKSYHILRLGHPIPNSERKSASKQKTDSPAQLASSNPRFLIPAVFFSGWILWIISQQ